VVRFGEISAAERVFQHRMLPDECTWVSVDEPTPAHELVISN